MTRYFLISKPCPAHTASTPMGTGDLSRDYRGRYVTLTSHIRLAPGWGCLQPHFCFLCVPLSHLFLFHFAVLFQIGRDGPLLILTCTPLSSSSLTRCSVTCAAGEL